MLFTHRPVSFYYHKQYWPIIPSATWQPIPTTANSIAVDRLAQGVNIKSVLIGKRLCRGRRCNWAIAVAQVYLP